MVTPQSVEQRMVDLEGAIDSASDYLARLEIAYQDAKAAFEIQMARSRTAPKEEKLTATQREDLALLENETEYAELMAQEGLVRAARANVNRLRMKLDIARSLGAALRASMEL